MLFDRATLSEKNKWYDEDGKLYIYCSIEEIQDKLNISEKTATKAKKDLAQYGLLSEARQGMNKPNKIYLFGFVKNTSLTGKKYKSGTVKNTSPDQQKLQWNNTEYINTEYINTEREIYSPVSDETRTTYLAEIKEAVSYLNSKAETKYRHSADKTQKLIRARLKDGFTLDDIKKVIDIKAEEWLKTDMSKYLRPETLFGSKFESYLNQPEPEKSEYDDLF